MCNIKVSLLNSNAKVPVYATEQSAGADLYACIESPITINIGHREIINTGIAIELPENYEAQIRSRSGLALKHGIVVLNSPGTIDADYRGEIKVILINLGHKDYIVNPNDKIAQIVFSAYAKAKFINALTLSNTTRGSGGFGSSGL